jgi:hypothetical protein
MEREIHEPQAEMGHRPSRRIFLKRAAGTGLAAVAGIALAPGLSLAGKPGQIPGTAGTGQTPTTAGGTGQTTPAGGTGQNTTPAATPATLSAQDMAVLNFVLLLERMEAAFYNLNGDKAFLGAGTLKSTIAEIRDHENQHVQLLEGVLGANARPVVQFQNLDSPTLGQFLTLAQTLEDVVVSAYLGAMASVQDKNILTTAAGIMDVDARHAGGIREYRKTAPSAGNPAEGGDPNITLTEDREPVNRARTGNDVLALVAPYIVGGIASVTTPTTTTPTTTPVGGTTPVAGTPGTAPSPVGGTNPAAGPY